MATDSHTYTSTPSAAAPKKRASGYFYNIGQATRTLLHGLKLTWRHFLESSNSRKPMGVEAADYFEQQTGIVTLQYPRESLPVPDNARYRLHNEIDDCIVCDKCAKICPVDCIEIEPVKAIETIGQTSDGTPKRIYAARFDIDMAKCCFCGLCTTVCPTECLTMTKAYDFSEFDVADHTYAFAEMTPLEILQKKKELEEFQAQKAAKAAVAGVPAAGVPAAGSATTKPGVARPIPAAARPSVARPGVARPQTPRAGMAKPAASTPGQSPEEVQEAARKLMEQKGAAQAPNPVAKSAPTPEGTEETAPPEANKPLLRPRPMMKPKTGTSEGADANAAAQKAVEGTTEKADAAKATGRPRPVMKPIVKNTTASADNPAAPETEAAKPAARPRPIIKPVIKQTAPPTAGDSTEPTATPEETPTSSSLPSSMKKDMGVPDDLLKTNTFSEEKPRPRPVLKPVVRKPDTAATSDQPQQADAEAPKKPRPVIKPVVPKPTMQKAPTPEEKGAGEGNIKEPKPIVNPKEIVRKPPQEDKSEEDKRQEDSQRPEPPGHPDR
ncbi:MAG: 4Fe-4S dicluster domain-containing protein [Bacteroidetes bacterium]|nr:4Fe-4S dicluster domain-containing protein [Bacteroidota bacterium]